MRSFTHGHFFVLAALCGSVVALGACGDDDTGTGSGGSGGSGGSATGGSGGGSAGTAGKGTGGSSDAGLDARDGAGGSAGSAGKGGAGGTAGAAGAGGKAGNAGAGGTAGKGGGAGSSGDGGVSDASTDGDSSGTVANVRVAHLSPGAPAVDFCLAPHGTTVFTGPVLSLQGVLTGLPYAAVTKYQSLTAGQYDLRIVAAGATSCATSLGGLPDQTNLPVIAAGSAVTIAAVGELAPGDGGGNPFSVKAFIDDTSVTAGKAKLRFVHASSGAPSVDVGTSGGALFAPLFSDVAFSNVASPTNGYIETAPLVGAEISARVHGSTTDVLAMTSTDLASGAISTAFAIGKIGNVATPFKVLLCLDNGASVGALTPCTVVGEAPKRAHLRVAHLAPDVPAVDVCLTPTGSTFAGTGLLHRLNVPAGLTYSQVTTYLDVPAAVTSYTVRLVAATATDCNAPAVPDTPGVVFADDLYATVGALGDLTGPPFDGGAADGGAVDSGTADAGTGSSFGLKVFVDDKAAPVPAGNINLRFIHASPGTAAVDVGLGSGGAFTPVFVNVAFRNFGAGVGIDPNGYISTAPLAAQTLSARLSGGTTDAIVVPNVTVAAGSLATAFAIGRVNDGNKPLKVLMCVDSGAAVGVLAPCTVLP